MNIFSETINGIVSDILNEDGYRKEEVALELEDEEPCRPIAMENCILFGVRGSGHNFIESDAEAMNKEALDLGVIKEPLVFPYMSKKNPHTYWNQLYSYNPSVSSDKRVELACLNAAGEVVLVEADTHPSTAISQYLNMEQEAGLVSHLNSGYCAYIMAKGDKAYWIDVPSYFLSLLWAKERYLYKEQVAKWELLSRTIVSAKELNTALKQQTKLDDLPFKWATAKVSKSAAVEIAGITYEQYHNTHLVLKEMYLGDDYHLMTGDFLCLSSQSDSTTENGDSLEYECKINDVILKRVPHQITCKQCHSHIDIILNGLTNEK